ncbi:FkbM family methyltransferase [Flavobacterium sp.]|uniref:FkbM family methyltransferase n=1 Tax=Flavobacterium sp. TaxID=239 RepID=UPI00286E3588|nr:FkbM family methyltransferase [Flavobacterium sp.]
MAKTNKISNLRRLNNKNKFIVVLYLIKRILRIEPTKNEENVYVYYNILINSNGNYLSETKSEFVSEINDNFYKCIKTRKKPKSSDLDAFNMIYSKKEYLPIVKVYFENFKIVNETSLNIIDAGSNIGLTSLFFIDYFKKATIVCIEPELENFKILEYNLKNCNDNKVFKINGAVWSTDCNIKIINDFKDKLDWSFRVEETEEDNSIKAFSINTIINTIGFDSIDILKIDVEGSEKQIFDKNSSNLDFLKITKCIAIEIHDFFDCRKQIYDVLDFYGFTYFNEGELTIAYNTNLALNKENNT